MKKVMLVSLVAMLTFTGLRSEAQVNVNINISSQPDWGPAGYNHVDYYYIPDIDVYYYVPSAQYIYLSNGRWVWRNSLPEKYRGYNLYNSYKVVMNTPKPYDKHATHVNQYSGYKGKGSSQKLLRDNRGTTNSRGSSNSRSSSPSRGNSTSRASESSRGSSNGSASGSNRATGNSHGTDSRERGSQGQNGNGRRGNGK